MDIIRSGHPQISRLEIVEKGRRRHFSDEAKLAIVAESYSGPQQVSATARRHEITRFQLNSWRKAALEGRLGGGSLDGFVPVVPDTMRRPSILFRLLSWGLRRLVLVAWRS